MALIDCPQCGNKISDKAEKCPTCGCSMKEQAQKERMKKILGLLKDHWKILSAAALGIVVVLIIISTINSNKKTIVSINDYIVFDSYGYNGYGSAEAYFDSQRFIDENREMIKPRKGYSIETMAKEFIGGHLEETDCLSNGDTLTWTWECNDQGAVENYRCILQHSDLSFTVSDLMELTLFDPFEGLRYEVDGVSPDGYIELTKVQDKIALDYRLNREAGLRNGDTVTVYVSAPGSEDLDDYCAIYYGVKLENTTKSVKIDGLPSYVRRANDISENALKTLMDDSLDAIDDEIDNMSDRITVTSVEPVRLFVYTDPTESRKWENIVLLIYKIGIHGDYDYNEELNDFSYFYGTTFYDVMLDSADNDIYSVGDRERFNSMFEYSFKSRNDTMAFFTGGGETFNGFRSLSDTISTAVDVYETEGGYKKVDEKDLNPEETDNENENKNEKSEKTDFSNLTDATNYLMFSKADIGYQAVDLSGNVWEKVVLCDDDWNCFLLDGKFKKIKGNLCLSETADHPVIFRFCGLNEEEADIDEKNGTRMIFNLNKVMYEQKLGLDGAVIPFEIDVSNYYTLGFGAELDGLRSWHPHMKVYITDVYLE